MVKQAVISESDGNLIQEILRRPIILKINFSLSCAYYDIIQIMPGFEGDLEEWQTQEVNVTRGEAEGDTDLEGLPFLKGT